MVALGDVHSGFVAQGGDDVEEVDWVEIELLAKRQRRVMASAATSGATSPSARSTSARASRAVIASPVPAGVGRSRPGTGRRVERRRVCPTAASMCGSRLPSPVPASRVRLTPSSAAIRLASVETRWRPGSRLRWSSARRRGLVGGVCDLAVRPNRGDGVHAEELSDWHGRNQTDRRLAGGGAVAPRAPTPQLPSPHRGRAESGPKRAGHARPQPPPRRRAGHEPRSATTTGNPDPHWTSDPAGHGHASTISVAVAASACRRTTSSRPLTRTCAPDPTPKVQ